MPMYVLPFVCSGESYAGIYVPTLAENIMIGNEKNVSDINLAGFMVGETKGASPLWYFMCMHSPPSSLCYRTTSLHVTSNQSFLYP